MSSKASYTVAIKNRFAQLDSDAESDSEVPAVAKPTPATTSGTSPHKPSGETRIRGTNEARRKPLVPKNGVHSEGGVAGRTSQQRRDEKPTGMTKDAEGEQRTSRRRPKPAAEGPAFRGARSTGIHTGRLHDRHSGTGRGREMKKSGAGGHNWGNEAVVPETNGRASAENSGSETPENESKVVDNGEQSPTAESGSTTAPQPAPAVPEETTIAFAAYQRERRLRRAMLQQTQLVQASVRSVNATELEKDGYQRYERDETEEERAAREQRVQKLHRHSDMEGSNDSDGEPNAQRKKNVLHLFQFKRPVGVNRRQGSRGGAYGQRTDNRVAQRSAPIEVDLEDVTAFPTLC